MKTALKTIAFLALCIVAVALELSGSTFTGLGLMAAGVVGLLAVAK